MQLIGELAAVAARNHGLVTKAQAHEVGVSEHHLKKLVSDGMLIRESVGVFSLAGAPRTWLHAVASARIRGGASAAVSHRSASMIWQFSRYNSAAIDITTPWPSRRPRLNNTSPADVRYHVSRDLRPEHTRVRHGLLVTHPTRTLVDMGSIVSAAKLGFMIDDAVARNVTTYEAVHALASELATPGRRGLETVRRVLEFRPVSGESTRSVLESAVFAEILKAGLPEPDRQYPVKCDDLTYHLDLAWPEVLVGVECDGFQFHRTPADLAADSVRMNELVLRGWLVHRVTWQMLRRDPNEMIYKLRRAYEMRSAQGR